MKNDINYKKFDTLLNVKLSLISLYLALTFPITFIADESLRTLSLVCLIIGFIITLSICNDVVIANDFSISLRVNFISKIFGKNSWEIFWDEIKIIKSFETSQGSKVFYFITYSNKSFLVPQRIEKFDDFKELIVKKTNFKDFNLKYISPLWTYNLLVTISVLMIVGEIYALIITK
tara:strand:- start:261 stop:788 length:528 start_codon:yes stop_codon:yes gene_type:complete